jgi:hypothetical protein
LADDRTSEPPKKKYTYQITKKMDNICPNFSTYLKAINSMAEVDDGPDAQDIYKNVR